ncbi:MAG TPA: acyl-CoA dehydrogenase family protein [Candidatus Xenobia bacterium]
MNFKLNEEQAMLQDMVRKFAQSEVAPGAAERDRTCAWPKEMVAKMGEQGLLGVCVPAEYGGAGMDTISYTLVIEELAAACASAAVIAAVQNGLVNYPILAFGTDEQKKKYLPLTATGQKIGAYCLTEPGSGSDSMGMATKAVKDGDSYRLTGTKFFVTNSMGAEIFIVYATLDASLKSKGVCAFIVEKSMKGFTVGKHEEMMGVRASGTCEVILDDVKVPVANMIGAEGQGGKIALATLDCGRLGIAAQAIGIARAAMETSLKYSQERKQFQQAIFNFQLIQSKLVEMAVGIDAARLLLQRAAFLRDTGVRFTKEASMAKWFASEVAVKAGSEGVQIHGGYGYTKEYPAERFFRDAKITQIYEGTSEIQKLVIARNLVN